MNSNDIIRRVLLVFLICVSILLSIRIWTNLSSSTISEKSSTPTNVTKVNSPEDVFLPTKLVVLTGDTYAMTERELIVDGTFDEFVSFGLKDIRAIDKKKSGDIKLLNTNPSMIFSYPDVLDLEYYLSVFEESATFDDEAPFVFNQIRIYEKQNRVLFVNSKESKYYVATCNGQWETLNNELKKEDPSYQTVETGKEILPTLFYYTSKIELPSYSYILSTQANASFTKIFFNRVDNVVSNDNVNSDDESLSNSYGETLAIRSQTGEVSYVGKFQSDNSSDTTIYGKSFKYIRLMESMYTNLRFFDVEGNLIVYQNYVEGYPVFGTDYKGQLRINIATNEDVIIQTNQKTIQIPVPLDEMTELDSTENVLNALVANGCDTKKLQDLQIGYTWKSRENSVTVIDLVPEWYVKYENKWQSVSSLLSMLK